MTRFTAFAAALLMTAGAASAQNVATTQAAVGGASGVAGYPTTVVGANGVTYACQAPETVDGVIARRCITPDAGGAGFASMSPAAIGGAAAVLIAIGVIANNNDDTNGTNGTNGT
jgi:hypothetical protein